MLTRVCSRICTSAVHSWKHGTHRVLGVTVSPRWSSSSRDDIMGSGPNVNLGASAGAQPVSVEGYQGQGNMHEFSAGRAQDIIDRAQEQMGMTAEERQASVQQGVQGTSDMEAAYSHTGNVSLHSVMEDGVPEPSIAAPNHRNMPKHGGIMEKGMYTSGQYAESHPSKGSKGYATYTGVQGAQDMRGTTTKTTSDVDDKLQGVQGSPIAQLARASNPCPQGVQGHECDRFKIWLNNCINYGLVNCDEQLQGVQTGRKTLSQIFEEQDDIIRKTAVEFSSSKQRT